MLYLNHMILAGGGNYPLPETPEAHEEVENRPDSQEFDLPGRFPKELTGAQWILVGIFTLVLIGAVYAYFAGKNHET